MSRRAEAFAVLDEREHEQRWMIEGLWQQYLAYLAALRSVLTRHHFDEFRGVCDGCHWSPCPDETDVIDALLGEER